MRRQRKGFFDPAWLLLGIAVFRFSLPAGCPRPSRALRQLRGQARRVRRFDSYATDELTSRRPAAELTSARRRKGWNELRAHRRSWLRRHMAWPALASKTAALSLINLRISRAFPGDQPRAFAPRRGRQVLRTPEKYSARDARQLH